MSLHVVHDGSRPAPPVLLLHGSGTSGVCWDPVVPALAAGHHVVRVDLAGHGRSGPAPSYAVPDQAARVARVLDELGLTDIAVIAHSSGGYVATELAATRPGLVRSLALISTGPALDAFRPQPAVLRLLLGPVLGRLLWPLRTDAMVRRAALATCARPVTIPDELVAHLRAVGHRDFRRVMRGHDAYLGERSVPDRLAAVGVPVPLLVIFGGADPRWDPASARRYTRVPGARVEMLPGVGHLPMYEAPAELTPLLLAFLG